MKGILAHKHKIKSGLMSLFFGVLLFLLFNSFQGALSSDHLVKLKQEEKPEPGLFYPNELINIPNDTAQKQLNEQSLLGLNWVQQSGEYVALAYQAFNVAKLAFNQALDNKINNPAVIVDIDETILNNSPYQAGFMNTAQGFNSKTWSQWIKAEQATAILGAVAFVNYVNSHGGKVFYISNREQKGYPDNQDLERATINNLKAVGFTGVNPETVILKGEFNTLQEGEKKSSKESRRQAVQNGKADGIQHTIVVLVGDNLDDFNALAGIPNSQRRERVKIDQKSYGVFNAIANNNQIEPAYIILPNPLYGDWEIGLYNPQQFGQETWTKLSPLEKNQQRQEALIQWKQE